MNYKQKIQITGKSIDDIFKLPCVCSVHKTVFGGIVFDLYGFVMVDGSSTTATSGEWLCELENGMWRVETNDN